MNERTRNVLKVLVIMAAVLQQGAYADVEQCTHNVPINVMTSKEDGIYKFMDGRELKGTVRMVGGCHEQRDFPTGGAYRTNFTMLSYDASVSSQECIDKKSNDGVGIYDSFQSILIESRGFQFQPELYVDDIDSLETKNVYNGELDTWKESAVVFGVSNGSIVHPTLALDESTFLKARTYRVPAEGTTELGMPFLGEIEVGGAEFDENLEPHNCPFASHEERSKCRMEVSFPSPIDALVIMYATTHKANQDTNAVMFASPLTLPCTCLCQEHSTLGVKYFEDPAAKGSCSRRQEGAKKMRYKCDMLSDARVCTYGYLAHMERTGPEDEGRFPCDEVKSMTITENAAYEPSAKFVL